MAEPDNTTSFTSSSSLELVNTTTSYMNSINEYKRLFTTLDTTQLIPSLNYFLIKLNSSSVSSGCGSAGSQYLASRQLDTDDILSPHNDRIPLIERNHNLSRVESFSFCSSSSFKPVKSSCLSECKQPTTNTTRPRYLNTGSLSASEPDLRASSADVNLMIGSVSNAKIIRHSKPRQRQNERRRKSASKSQTREFNFLGKFKVQFRTNTSYWNIIRQFISCKSRYQVNENSMSDSGGDVRLLRCNLLPVRLKSKSLDYIAGWPLSQRKKTNSSKIRKLESMRIREKKMTCDDSISRFYLKTPQQVAPITTTTTTTTNSSGGGRMSKMFYKFDRRRYMSDTNLKQKRSTRGDEQSAGLNSLLDDKTLQLFLSKKKYSQRRNAICSKIDKLYYNKQTISYMEFLLREDYIKNFLL